MATQFSNREQVSEHDIRYTDALASELIRHLGVEAAMRTCSENHWAGVLEAVRRHAASRTASS